jgi:hypothetical protein
MTMRLPSEKIFEMLPAGTHLAVCNRVIDLGAQETAFGSKHQIMLGWETAEEKMTDGRPFAISRRYVLSTDRRSNFRADLEGMLGRPLASEDFGKFDLSTLLGLAVLLQVKHEIRETRTFANVTSVMAPPKGTPARLSANGAICFSFEPFDKNAFEALPTWTQDVIRRSPEYQAATRAASGRTGSTAQHLRSALGKGGDLPSDGIPF